MGINQDLYSTSNTRIIENLLPLLAAGHDLRLFIAANYIEDPDMPVIKNDLALLETLGFELGGISHPPPDEETIREVNEEFARIANMSVGERISSVLTI